MSYRFQRSESVRAGFRRIAGEACDRFCIDLAGEDGADVHEARKRCKMLRALLCLVRRGLDRADFRELNGELRDIARKLGPARDAEVRRETFEQLLAAQNKGHALQFPVVSRSLDAGARAARNRVLSVPAMRAIIRRIGVVQERLRALELRDHGWAVIHRGLHRAYARGRRRLREDKQTTAAARHAWRKDVKTLWYHIRLLAGVRGEKLSALEKKLDALGELLGDDRDLALLAAHLRRNASTRPHQSLFSLIQTRRDELFGEAREQAASLFEKKARAFTTRIEKWWHAWRQ